MIERIENFTFTYNSISAASMGVKLLSQPHIQKPKPTGISVTVPGRSGDLWIPDGAYAPISVKIDIAVVGDATLYDINKWLSVPAHLIFSNDPEHYYESRLDKDVEYQSLYNRLSGYKTTVIFTCQPFKRKVNETAIVCTGDTVFYGYGNVNSAPLITVTGSGTFDFTINGKEILVTDLPEQYTGIVLDSELLDAFDTEYTAFLNPYVDGEFPALVPGSNSVDIGSAQRIVIQPRWRWI